LFRGSFEAHDHGMHAMKVFKRGTAAVIGLALALSLVPTSARSVNGENAGLPEPSRVARGSCSGPSRWRLAVRREGDDLRVTLVVRGGSANQQWNVFMDHNGRGFFAGSRVSGPDGAFGVRRAVPDLPGVDRIRMGANAERGESCRGRVRT
jgi:hypothetical protein